MIIGRANQIDYAYLAIPRTSSNSMIWWLRQHYGGWQHGHHHSWKLPEGGVYDQIFTIIRHPYFRAISLYRNVIRTGKANERPWGKIHGFTDFLLRLIELSTNIEQTAYTVPEWMVNQATYCDLAHVDTVLYLDYLSGMDEEELRKLRFVNQEKKIFKYPHRNKTPEHYGRSDYDSLRPFDYRDIIEEQERLIFEWAREDFERFGFIRFLGDIVS